MKIEIGESLIYSYLRHEKNCLVTQTNWKASGNWHISQDIRDRAIYEFNKINKHHAFSDIFRSDFNQTIRQAEIDALGIDQDNHIYAFEVAFHENGLQYGGKIETRNRIFKKLLRGLITLKCYFPNSKYTLAFCSPKVNPATEKHIQEYFEVLKHDFQSDGIEFYYYSNELFNSEITQKTLVKTLDEADSSELFVRSIKLMNTTNKFHFPVTKPLQGTKEVGAPVSLTDAVYTSDEYVMIGNISIPIINEPTESVQDYVKKIMHILLDNNILDKRKIEYLRDKEYCKRVFMLPLPLVRYISEGCKDNAGRNRYWSKETFGNGQYYVCSQWWKEDHPVHMIKLRQWLLSIQDQ